MKDKIIEMLGNGIPATVVAKACGVTDSYISQLMADESIRAQVTEAKVKDIEGGIRVDDLIEDIELTALENLKSKMVYMGKPRDLLAVFQAMNTAKKKTAELTSTTVGGNSAPLVQINISAAAAIQFKMDSVKQVVEVDGRSMTTLPARALNERLAEKIAHRPAISDATSASYLLDQLEVGLPETLAHEL